MNIRKETLGGLHVVILVGLVVAESAWAGACMAPRGTTIEVQVQGNISSRRISEGEPFQLLVNREVREPAGERILVRQGSVLVMTLHDVRQSGRIFGRERTSLTIDEIVLAPCNCSKKIVATVEEVGGTSSVQIRGKSLERRPQWGRDVILTLFAPPALVRRGGAIELKAETSMLIKLWQPLIVEEGEGCGPASERQLLRRASGSADTTGVSNQ